METKSKQDLRVGEIYTVCTIENGVIPNKNIFMWGGHDASCYIGGLVIRGEHKKEKPFFKNTPGGSFGGGNSRESTKEEKAWLLACIKANKLVPRDQVKLETYKIFN